jgi:hypothetical protein
VQRRTTLYVNTAVIKWVDSGVEAIRSEEVRGHRSENTIVEPKMTDVNLTTGDAGDGPLMGGTGRWRQGEDTFMTRCFRGSVVCFITSTYSTLDIIRIMANIAIPNSLRL